MVFVLITRCPQRALCPAYQIQHYFSYSIYTKVQKDSLTAELPRQGGCWRLPVCALIKLHQSPKAKTNAVEDLEV